MRRVLILEDERPAQERLVALLGRVDPTARVVACLPRVDEAVAWLARKEVDLILADIRLQDGLSLDALGHDAVRAPVVFTTAYDRYWAEAFAGAGVDYLLKPVSEEALRRALDKVDALSAHFSRPWRALAASLATGAPPPRRRRRLLGRRGQEHVVVPVEEVAWITTEDRLTFVVCRDGARWMVDPTLAELEDALDGEAFFRLNRQVLAHVDAVARFQSVGRGRLRVQLTPGDDPVFVSQERAARFRAWLDR